MIASSDPNFPIIRRCVAIYVVFMREFRCNLSEFFNGPDCPVTINLPHSATATVNRRAAEIFRMTRPDGIEERIDSLAIEISRYLRMSGVRLAA